MIRRGWFIVLSLVVATLLLVVLGLGHLRARVVGSRLPERGRAIESIDGCPGLAEVLFDPTGAPHVFSGSESALWFTQGYLQARDRFFQMDLMRRRANGRLAELFGAKALDSDRKMRVLRIAASARRQSSLLSATERRVLETYADGVNAAIRQFGSWIAPEVWLLGTDPEPWTVEDSLAIALLLQLDLSRAMGEELQRAVELSRMGRDRAVDIWGWTPAEARAWIPPGEVISQPIREHEPITGPSPSFGSNAWAVLSSRSASDSALLANDFHLGVENRGLFYPIHLDGPNLKVAGASIAGVPGVLIGHTRDVAFGLTFSMMDDQDLFRLTLDDSGNRELIDGRWRPLRTIAEDVAVRWQLESVLVKVRVSVHGPIVRDRRDEPLALAWSGFNGPSFVVAMLGMNRAATAADAVAAWAPVIGPSLNLIAVDTTGAVLQQVVGRVPERSRGAGRLPSPGSDSKWAWGEFLPMSVNPKLDNPAEGFLVTTGHDPFAEGEVSSRGQFPAEFAPPWRARRIRSVLAMRDDWTVGECLELQSDITSGQAIAALKLLRPTLEQHGGVVARELMQWDARFSSDSTAATAFARLMLALENAIGGDEAARLSLVDSPLGPEEVLRLLAGGVDETWWDDVSQPGSQTREDILKGVLLRLDGDSQSEPWGDVHRVEFSHPLSQLPGVGKLLSGTWNRGPFAVAGDAATVNSAPWDRRMPFAVEAIPAVRFVTDVGDWDTTVLGLATGQSGRPWSSHYSDQVRDWLDGNAAPFPFSRAAVEDAAVASLHLTPKNVRIPTSAGDR